MNARDVVAIVLAGAFGAVLVLVVLAVVFGHRTMTTNGVQALIVIGGAVVGALGGYLLVHKPNGKN